jgi:hypothetical protein
VSKYRDFRDSRMTSCIRYSGMVIVLSLAASGWGALRFGATTKPEPGLTVAVPSTAKPHQLLLVKGQAVRTLAVVGPYLTWEQGTSRSAQSMLMERVVATGKTKLLASNALAQFGLATTTTRVVFAARGRSGLELVAVRHDGGGRLVLTRSLAAPIAARGDLVAWAEQSASSQRVVVRHMRTGHEWVAAQMSRCRRGRCYRIDSVTLADKGVVFERGAIGPHPSLIVRRGFSEERVTTASVAHDPQPELAASSAGALFYWLQHGWFRWDFGQRRPHLVKLPASRSWVLAYERGGLLLQGGSQCDPTLTLKSRRQSLVIHAPPSTPASPKGFGPLCRLMSHFHWQDRRLAVAWSIIPKISLRSGADVGLVGTVVALPTPKDA